MRLLPLALLAALALAAPASAAYAPKLAATLDPATPGTPGALTTVVTQAPGETASRKVVLEIPTGFSPVLGTTIPPCTDADRDARACPEASKIGEALAQTPFGPFSGGVHFAPPTDAGLRFYVFLSNGIPLLDQTLTGVIEILPTGFRTTLDGLPDVPTTSFRLALAGGDRALLRNPDECGTYTLRAAFTSQQGESATSEAPVEIAPCANRPPRIESLRAKKRRLRFSLDEDARVAIKIRRRGRTVRVIATRDRVEGAVRVRLPKLRRGRYRVQVVATDAGGASSSRSVRYRVR